MIYTVQDGGGNVTSSGNTAPSGGGGSGKSILNKGYLWPSSGAYPTSMTAHREAVTDGGTTATVTQGDGATAAGTVVGIAGYIYGSTGGVAYTWTLYKNGVATALTTSTSRTDAGNSISSNATVPFVVGDVLQVWSMAGSGATAQATKGSITVTLT